MDKIKLYVVNGFKQSKVIINRLWYWAQHHTKKALLFSILILICLVLLKNVFSLKLDASSSTYHLKGLSEVNGVLTYNSGEKLVYENQTKALYINTKTTNLRIVDKSTNKEWNTLATSVADKMPENTMSPFVANYFKGLESISLDAYTYSIMNEDGIQNDEKGFEMNLIDQGVQVVYYLEDLNFLKYLFEYIPRQMKVESYEEKLLGKLDALKEEGKITTAEYQNYLSVFDSVYIYDSKETPARYSYSYSGYPPVNRARKLLEVFTTVGYTREDLVEDNDTFGIMTPQTEIPRMKVVIELTLDGDDFLVRIPTYEITSNVEDAVIANIKVFPYFGDVNGKKYTSGEIFVPDGSGALIKLNSYSNLYPFYEKPFYDNKVYNDYYYRKYDSEKITMPVFGMIYGDQNGVNQGYLAIIENGAEVSTLYANPANTKEGSLSINQIYSRFYTYQHTEVNIYGEYSTNNTARYLFKGDFIDFDYETRYLLLTEENQTYYSLAKNYQNYLIKKHGLVKDFENQTRLFLDVIGTVKVKNRLLGIPYDTELSMTTYDELYDILMELSDVNYVVNYRGAFNGGLYQGLPTQMNFVEENGSRKDYEKLLNYIDSQQGEFYFDLLFGTPYNTDYGFSKGKYGATGYNNEPITMYQYNLASNNLNFNSTPWYLLNAMYLEDVVNQFKKNYTYTENIAIRDLGHIYFADNGSNDLNPVLANYYVKNAIDNLDQQYNLSLNNPYIDYAVRSKYVGNVDRGASRYGIFTSTIPFKELALNGLTTLYSEDVNMNNNQDVNYYLLQAIELGINPKFTISHENSNVLMNTEFNFLYSSTYDHWKNDIRAIWDAYKQVTNQIGSTEITNHEILAPNVYKTTYSTGIEVIVNYNKNKVRVLDKEIEAMGYHIMDKGE